MVQVVCPRCTSAFQAQPGTDADCPACGFSGGRVPGDPDTHVYAAGTGSYTFQSQGFAAPGAELEKAKVDAEKKAQEKAGKRETSGLAVASLVVGLLVFIPIAGIVAFALGIGGIAQTGKDKLKGRAMAVTGMVVGGLAQVVWFAVIIGGFAILGRLVQGG